ncbi:MAG TPA: OsmC family protein [bacterium]|nr:OsmC family protein [bacterium]
MAVRTANAVWNGTLREGTGTMALGSGAFEGPFSFGTRFEEAPGTNPEELIGAALAGCFSMALAAGLVKGGHNPERIATTAQVHLEAVEGGFGITHIDLTTEANIPNISEADFQAAAQATKTGCPVSKALTGTTINLDARLVQV